MFPLGRARLDAGHLGEQVGPPSRELTELGHRGILPVRGQLAQAGVPPRRTGQPGDEDTVSLRTLIDHAFEYD